MPRDLPNLDWLRVFAAAAGAESFVVAADKLGVTAGAVSQRVKSLEGFLGVALFRRHAQGVRLTDAGLRYATALASPLHDIALATRDLAPTGSAAPVRMTVLPAFAQIWLGPRLADFHRFHGNTHVEIWADAQVVDVRTSPFDLAIRYGQPPFAGCDFTPILTDMLVPVAAPALAAVMDLGDSDATVDAPLNVDSYWASDFDDWRRATGARIARDLKTQTFSLYSMALDATLLGRGWLMGHAALVTDHLTDGRLVRLSNHEVRTANQFYLVTKSGAVLSPAAQAFIEWLLGQSDV